MVEYFRQNIFYINECFVEFYVKILIVIMRLFIFLIFLLLFTKQFKLVYYRFN